MMYRRIFLAAIVSTLALMLHIADVALARTPEYDLHIAFDIDGSKIAGVSKIQVLRGQPMRLRVGHLRIRKVEVNRKPVNFLVRDRVLTLTPAESGDLEIGYEGIFESRGTRPASQDTAIPAVIGRKGIFLSSTWYPQIDGLATFRLKAVLPRDYVAVSEADGIQKRETKGAVTFSFQFHHPVDQISFIATDRYRVIQERFHGIELAAYFFPEDRSLARRYLDYAKQYIQLYETLLLPYPFKRFAIVENFLPTGYSMPTYTLLGQAVVKLPFIVETSLGHEVLHQWFGNQVYASEQGNWAEGLTTYLADHFYEERKGEGWRYRKQMLIDYGNYVHDSDDFPLNNFTSRFDAASRSIGYGKAAMVFHMLRQTLGDEAFFAGLKALLREKQFQRASWDDLRNAFQRQTGRELGWFFDQWIERKGLPEIETSDFAVVRDAGAFALTFDLAQRGAIYRLDVPVKILFGSDGEKNVRVRLDERHKRVRIESEREPTEVVIDENYDLARRLIEREVPPVIASLIGAKTLIVVTPVHDENRYREVISGLRARGAEVKPAESLSAAEVRSATLVVLGNDHPFIRGLYGRVELAAAGFNVLMKKNPWNPMKTVGILSARSEAEAKPAFPKLFHYGKYSQLAFENGRNVSATVDASERGMRENVEENTPAVDLSTLKTLAEVIKKLASRKIIYAGEEHDKVAHHKVQLEMLRALYRQNPKIAVGMEMFQRPSQKALDDYTAGAIDERTFLKTSEYFKHWNIDYHFYKPILDFARAKHLPVIALNLRAGIVDKVARGGLDSLTKEEKQEIPQELDFSDRQYRARLEQVFATHDQSRNKNFEFFYQAQILWDETMAESIDRFLKKNPDFRVLVLAGSGHLEYGSGIPKRAFRRNGFDYAIVVSDAEPKKEIADFIVFPEASKGPTAPRLGVAIDEDNQTVRIKGFANDSVAAKAGLKVDDTLLALDGYPVASVEDIRIALFYKRSGEMIKVKVKRGNDELEFDVTLP